MKKGLGWRPDLPDIRDYTVEHEAVQAMLAKLRGAGADPPESMDLRAWCSPIDDQGELGACTAHAAAGMYEYFEQRAFGRFIDVSRLFLYKTTRNLAKLTGDSGAELRNAMGALALFGAPPEDYWPYKVKSFDVEPPAFCYAFGQSFQALKYFRLDPPGSVSASTLSKVRKTVASGLPAMFGFTCYSSLYQADDGLIPMPGKGEKVVGGHAVLCVGYNDDKEITGSKGALLIRNSWGTGWGDQGYGWLPYDYVLKGLAEDFWAMLKAEYIDTGAFTLP